MLNATGLSHAAWASLSRLGEAQILLPAMLLAALWMAWHHEDRQVAVRWVVAAAVAAALTTASKIAFIGYEIGYAPWNYTGLSGHAMFACAILPVLAAVAAGRRGPATLAAGAGVVLALAVAVSRVAIGAHSWADVVLGSTLGLCAATLALRALWRHDRNVGAIPLWLPAGVLVWLLVTPSVAPPSRTHDWVTTLSLAVSGRPAPYTRAQMMRAWRVQRAAEAAATTAAR